MTISASVVFVQLRWVARVTVCAFATVVFHDGRHECLYRFLAGFPFNKPVNHFSLLMKIASLASFKKKLVVLFLFEY
jgi:hypothetical protein